MNKFHKVEKLIFKKGTLIIYIDEKEYQFKLSNISKKLAKAADFERDKYEISPSGYGIHWPLIDEDLSIDGLIGIKHAPQKIKEKTAQVNL